METFLMWNFQITADGEQKAEKFMEFAKAWDVSIEEWPYDCKANQEGLPYLCGFGMTFHSPEFLGRIAKPLGVTLVYYESEQEIENRTRAILSKVLSNHGHSQS
jgi:hypothetical protein